MIAEKTHALRKSPPPSPPEVPPGWPRELADHPQYEVLEELGRGGMGVVYLVRNRLLDRREVLKVVSPGWLATPGAMERFLREIQTAGRLRHENVVGAYSAIQVGALFAFAMEYVDGQDLYRLVESSGPLSPAQASDYIRQAALGLQHAYEKGTIHRDIKPQNLILAREGNRDIVKILDFGIAKATGEKRFDPRLTDENSVLGTPEYIAPERVLDPARADIRADIYSLGCTAYFLLTGQPPFQADNLYQLLQAHHSLEPIRVDRLRPDVPVGLAGVIARMLQKDPARRFQRPFDVAEALDGNAPIDRTEVLPFPTPPPLPPGISEESDFAAKPARAREKSPTHRRLWICMSTAILLAGITLGGVAFLTQANDAAEPLHSNALVLPPLPVPLPAGVLVLDDCDPQSSGKTTYRDNLTLLDAAGERKFRVSNFNGSQTIGSAHRIAVDWTRKAIWVVEDSAQRVRRFDFEGQPTLTLDGIDGTALAVDPDTGNIWVTGTGSETSLGTTRVYTEAGKLVATHPIGGLDIVHDPQSKSFWIAFRSLTKVDAATGEVTFSKGVAGFCISSIDADRKNGGVWLAVRGADIDPKGNRLLRLDANGDERLQIDLGKRNPFSVSVDAEGGVWVAYLRQGIEHFSATGAKQGTFDMPALAVLASDDGSAWAATLSDLRKIAPNGAIAFQRNHASQSGQAWLARLGPR